METQLPDISVSAYKFSNKEAVFQAEKMLGLVI